MPAPAFRPITAELIRAANDIPVAALPEVRTLFTSLAQGLQTSLASLTKAPFRISLDGISEIQDSLTPADSVHFAATSPLGKLGLSMTCDRGFVVGLADLAFGGTGKAPPADSEDRPLSHIELCLQQAVYDDLKTALPGALSLAFSTDFKPMSAEGDPAQPNDATKTMQLLGRYLLNGFGYSGEFRLVVRRTDLVKIFRAKAAAVTATPGETITNQIHATEVEVHFALPPQHLTLAQLGEIRIGRTIRLEATPRDPILLISEGQELLQAELTFEAGRLGCVIRGPAAGSSAGHSTRCASHHTTSNGI